MRPKTITGVAAIIVLLLAAVALGTISSARAAALDNNRWGANYFPNITLTTQDGQQVHFYDDLLKGKIVVIDLIYTHCVDACPLETARLASTCWAIA
jgi:protein SCO1/2